MEKRIGEAVLGVVGGLIGIFAGALVYYLATFGQGDALAKTMGMVAILLGILGLIGGLAVDRYRFLGGALMLIAGVIGFFAVSAFWIVPGIIMIIGGILTFKRPKVLKTPVEGGGGYV